jgi:hypothetical protein
MSQKRAVYAKLSEHTIKQLDRLAELWGTKTTALSIVIDRAYREEIKTMNWIKEHYKIGRYARVWNDDSEGYEAAEIINHVQGSGLQALHTTAITVRFEDGAVESVAAEFLSKDGSDLVEGMPGT